MDTCGKRHPGIAHEGSKCPICAMVANLRDNLTHHKKTIENKEANFRRAVRERDESDAERASTAEAAEELAGELREACERADKAEGERDYLLAHAVSATEFDAKVKEWEGWREDAAKYKRERNQARSHAEQAEFELLRWAEAYPDGIKPSEPEDERKNGRRWETRRSYPSGRRHGTNERRVEDYGRVARKETE